MDMPVHFSLFAFLRPTGMLPYLLSLVWGSICTRSCAGALLTCSAACLEPPQASEIRFPLRLPDNSPNKQQPTPRHACLAPPACPGLRAQGLGLRGLCDPDFAEIYGGPWPKIQSEPPSVYTSAQAASYFFLCLSSVPLWSPVFFLLSLSCPRCLSSSLASLMSLGSWSRVAVPLGLLS